MAQTCSHLEIPERATYCPSCGVQVRCKICRQVINPTDRFCIDCGNSMEALAKSVISSDKPHEAKRNVIEFEEDATGRRFYATVSDSAIEAISHPISVFLARGTSLQPRRLRTNASNVAEEEPLISVMGLPLDNENLEGSEDGSQKDLQRRLSPGKDEELEVQRLKELFRERTGRLRLEEPQLKAKGKMDYARRLTYLYLYAEEKAGRESVPRSTLTTILNDSSVNDGNSRTWIVNEPALVKDGDQIHLNSAGRRVAQAVVKEVFSEDIKPGWLPGETSPLRTAKPQSSIGSTGNREQPAKGIKGKGGRTSRITTEWVPKWTALSLLPNAYFVFKEKSLLEKGMLGLWALREALGDEGRIIASRSLAKFMYHAFEFKVHIRSLETALKSKRIQGKVHHMGGTKFQITPEGMEYVAQIVKNNKANAPGGDAARAKAAG